MISDLVDMNTYRYIELQGIRPNLNSEYPTNSITRSQYTALNFLPKSLLHQFSNPSKLWFLTVSLLEVLGTSEITYKYGTIIPLVILLLLQIFRDGINDYNRHVLDREINLIKYSVWNGGNFKDKLCKDILVGDILILKNGDSSPADVLLLSVGNEEHQCYVDVSEILGEGSLKIMNPVKDSQDIINCIEEDKLSVLLTLLNDDLFVLPPNKSFKIFKGKMKLSISPKGTDLAIDNLIMRGYKIVNTPWVIGVVVYTGRETKIWINNLTTPAKTSEINHIVEKWLLRSFLVMITIIAINTLIYSLNTVENYSWTNVLLQNLLLFNHIIPISLILSLEIVRMCLTIIMYRKEPNIKINSSNLFSNTGMVEYILTDKTGTLTENKLKLSACFIDGKLYVDNDKFNQSAHSSRNDQYSDINSLEQFFPSLPDYAFSFKDLSQDLDLDEESKYLHFFLCITICNLAYPENNEILAISVDDKALVKAANDFGFKLLLRDEEMCVLDLYGEETFFYVMGIQAFSNENKVSRIVVKKKNSKKVYMYLKGTKSAIKDIYSGIYEDEDLENCLSEYRCLYLGYKILTRREVKKFLFEYSNARLSLVNREGRVESVFEKFEKGAEFLGILGLEDHVTEETKSTVNCLKKAGIKFWVLSGDSEESTRTSAIASGIIQPTTKVLRLVDNISELDCLNYLESYVKNYIFSKMPQEKEEKTPRKLKNPIDLHSSDECIKSPEKLDSIPPQRKSRRRSSVHPILSQLSLYKHLSSLEREYNVRELNFVLSIDSKGLEYSLESQIHMKYFIYLLFTAKAVYFHSLLPDQKTKVVKLAKSNFKFKPLVLALGDCMSDIGMIQEAQIGVGIEKTEAGRNADVTIKKFSDLKNLLLIHGHAQYVQLSKMILFSFYAMTLLELELWLYSIVSCWTASSILSPKFLLVYKLVLSIIPVAGLCLVDTDSASIHTTPQAYKVGIFNTLLTLQNIIRYVFLAIIQSSITFLFFFLHFQGVSNEGKTENRLMVDASVYLILSSTAFFSIVIETSLISIKTVFVYLVSLAIQIGIVLSLDYTDRDSEGYGDMLSEYNSVWMYIIITTLINTTITYAFKAAKFILFPGILEKVIKSEHDLHLSVETRLKQFKKTINGVYKESNQTNKKDFNYYKINYWLLKFSSHFLEYSYQQDKITEDMKKNQIFLLIGALSITFFTINVISKANGDTSEYIFLSICSFAYLLSVFTPRLNNFRRYSLVYVILYYILAHLFYLIVQVVYSQYCLSMLVFFPILGMIGFSNYWLELTMMIYACAALTVINAVYTFSNKNLSMADVTLYTISYSIIYISLCTISSVIAYQIDKSKRIQFLMVQKAQLEMQKVKSVLNYLLPAFVRKRVKNGVRFISENQGIVSIIFCDISNFDVLLSSYGPQELTLFLDDLFGRLDRICILSGCTKIETVGKTYMACAGLKESESELDEYYTQVPHARRSIEMGIAILRNIESIVIKNNENIKFKIGINSGQVTAGVVGYHKPQFSLVGDTVNTASRMASLCPHPNTIQISDTTYGLIGNTIGLVITPHSVVAKGKGLLNTYLVGAPVENDSGTLSVKMPLTLNQSISELFNNNSFFTRPKNVKKITLGKFNNQHDDNKRRSSLISILESEVSIDNEFLRRQTESINQLKWFSLFFCDTPSQKEFKKQTIETNYLIVLICLVIRIICNLFLLGLSLIDLVLSKNYMIFYELIKLIIEITVLCVLLKNIKKYFADLWFTWAVGLFYLAGAILDLGNTQKSKDLMFLDYTMHIIQAGHCSHLLFNNFIAIGFFCFILYIGYAGVFQFSEYPEQILSSIIYFLIVIYSKYDREQILRYYTKITKAAQKELKKTEKLLTHMMPKHVFENLKEQNSITETIKNVTILYADIVGFTQWSAQKTPEQVVNMLSELFTRFDDKCMNHQVYKVHTIGDCYVAIGYMEAKERLYAKECYNMAMFSCELIEVIKEVNEKNGIDLSMRIGMHTGDIIGGITGTSIVRYDIYGLDVIIANKLESTGKPGHVKISNTTMEILNSYYPEIFIFIKDEDTVIDVENKLYYTYFLYVKPEYLSKVNEENSIDFDD